MTAYRGFTLIELLIALAVAAILATIAIPAYTTFTQKAARSDAMSALMDVRLKQETHRLKNTSYATSVGALGLSTTSPNGKYSISVVAGSTNAATFKAEAVPQGAQASDDCGTFAINHAGPVTTGSYADAACWKR